MPRFNSQVIFLLLFSLSFYSFADKDHSKSLAEPLFNVTVPETEIIGQFHGDPINADLRLYMAGNQFVAMDLLVEEFKRQHPKYKNIFYVTIPPGKELKWILNGGIEIHGENSKEATGFQLRVLPDVYTTVNKGHMDQLNAAGFIKSYQTYAHNRLVLMVDANDPLANTTLDAYGFYQLMADSNIGISEPDIGTQGIERHIWKMYNDVSRVVMPTNPAIQALDDNMFSPANLANDPVESLRRIVYADKVTSGKTLLTSIHHLETPNNIRHQNTRLGPVWVTEVKYQQNRLGNTDLAAIELGGVGLDGKFLDRREKVNYLAAKVNAKGDGLRNNRRAANAWLDFLSSESAQTILENVGFIRAASNELANPFIYPSLSEEEKEEEKEKDDD